MSEQKQFVIKQPDPVLPLLIGHMSFSCYSKMNVDKRVESPIPILPLSTPAVETEKLIKRKDEEVSGRRHTLLSHATSCKNNENFLNFVSFFLNASTKFNVFSNMIS